MKDKKGGGEENLATQLGMSTIFPVSHENFSSPYLGRSTWQCI